MVLCNPRDPEAAHRAEVEGIATDDRAAVTCRKCKELLFRTRQLTPADTRRGYDAWAPSYDEEGNPMVGASAWVLDHAPLGCDGLDVVEVGCGTGRNIARVLAGGARSYVGVEPSSGMLAKARARQADPRVTFVEGDATAIAPASCDLVLMVLVLEHVAELAPVFGAIARGLRPGGRFRLVEIHPGLVAAGTVAHFADGDGEVRFASVAHAIDDVRAALGDAGLAVTSVTEHAADGALLDAVTRLGKHRGRPVVVDVSARSVE